jgi:hypothetical protein
MKAAYGLDIGLAPMADVPANLYKTNNKYREYGAMHIAGIYTNTSPYKESVSDGVTGLLVEHSANAWRHALEQLIRDKELRDRIADAAYADVRTRYAQDVVAEQWRDFLLSFAAESRCAMASGKVGRVGIASIRAQHLLEHTRIRALMLRERVKAKIGGAVKRMSRERSL